MNVKKNYSYFFWFIVGYPPHKIFIKMPHLINKKEKKTFLKIKLKMKGSKTNIQHNRVDSNKTKLCLKKEKVMKVLLCNIPRELKKKSIYLGKAAK